MKPNDKKAMVSAVGEELVARHGKRKYYEPDQIRRAAQDRGYPIDYVCWAYCIFSSPSDFTAIHDALGETCDQSSMKAEVLTELVGAGGFEWPDIDLSWLEWQDIDLSDLFGWFD